MTSVKPELSDEAVRALLAERFIAPAGLLVPVGGGQIAQTFAFTAEGRAYIIRFNHTNMLVNLEKEAYIYRHFAAPLVPIPPVHQIGHLDGFVYAITEKMPGRSMMELPQAEVIASIPAMFATLDAIHAGPVDATTGYGIFDANGVGLARSWRESLARIDEEEAPDDFFGRWHHMFEDTILEREVFQRVYAAMVRLLDRCPEERGLVHGNYGFGNLLLADGQVTAVLDWINAKYGDFVYDLAWLDFWAPALHFGERFAAHYTAQGRAVPAYAERLRCYEYYIGLDALRYFAKTDQHPEYIGTRNRLLAWLA
jgi:hygromycin-B 4-O-kinase